jgi:hypothetical protein
MSSHPYCLSLSPHYLGHVNINLGDFWIPETGSQSIIQAVLELTIFLSLPPKCWDYSSVPPCPALDMVFLKTIIETVTPNQDNSHLYYHLMLTMLTLSHFSYRCLCSNKYPTKVHTLHLTMSLKI